MPKHISWSLDFNGDIDKLEDNETLDQIREQILHGITLDLPAGITVRSQYFSISVDDKSADSK